MKITILFLVLLFFLAFLEYSRCEEVVDYRSLEGLQKVNETITVEIKISGDEPFNLQETKIKEMIRKKLRELSIQLDGTNNANANFHVNIEGQSTGGGGSSINVRLVLISRVPSPFKPDNKIRIVAWSTEKHDEQTVSYDPEKKKLVKVKGKLNDRVYAIFEQALNKLGQDYKRANAN